MEKYKPFVSLEHCAKVNSSTDSYRNSPFFISVFPGAPRTEGTAGRVE